MHKLDMAVVVAQALYNMSRPPTKTHREVIRLARQPKTALIRQRELALKILFSVSV